MAAIAARARSWGWALALCCALCLLVGVCADDGVDVDVLHAGLLSSDTDMTVAAIEASLDGRLVYACGSFSGHALFGRTSVESVGRSTFFMAHIDVAKNEVPLLYLDQSTEGNSTCAGLNRIGYHLFAFVSFHGPSVTVGDSTVSSKGSGGLAQFEIATDDASGDSLLYPLMYFSGEFEVSAVDVGMDNLAVVGTFRGQMKNFKTKAHSDNTTAFLAYGDHHFRESTHVLLFEDTGDSTGTRITSVCVSDNDAMIVGGYEMAVISDDVTSSMVEERVGVVALLAYDAAKKHLRLRESTRLRYAFVEDVQLLWHAEPEAAVVVGTFSSRLGTQADGHPHHYVYPLAADGDVDAFSAAFAFDGLRMQWLNSMGYPGAAVRAVFAATSRVQKESNVASVEAAEQVYVSGSFSGPRLAAGEFEQASKHPDEGGPTLFIAQARRTGEWTRLSALGDSTGAAEATTDVTVNNVESRVFLAAHAALRHGDPPEVLQIEWVGDVSALPARSSDGGAGGDGNGTTAFTISESDGGGMTLGRVAMYVVAALVVLVAFGSALALLVYIVRRPELQGDDYSAVALA